MRAGDLTRDDIGAVVAISLGVVNVVGKLIHISWPLGMVRLGLTDADDESKVTFFTVPTDKDVTVSRDWLRKRSLTEPKAEQRDKYLDEFNRLNSVMEES